MRDDNATVPRARRHCPFDGDPQAKSDRRRHDFIVQRALRGRSPGRVSPAHDQGDGRLPLELDAARGLLVSLRRGTHPRSPRGNQDLGCVGRRRRPAGYGIRPLLAAVSGSGGGRTTRGRVLASGEPPVGHRGSGRSEDLRSAPVRDRHPLGLAELPATRGQRVAPRERGRLDAAALSLLVRLQRAGRPAELPPHTTVGRHRTRDPVQHRGLCAADQSYRPADRLRTGHVRPHRRRHPRLLRPRRAW